MKVEISCVCNFGKRPPSQEISPLLRPEVFDSCHFCLHSMYQRSPHPLFKTTQLFYSVVFIHIPYTKDHPTQLLRPQVFDSVVFIDIPCPITLGFLKFTFHVPLLCCFCSHFMSYYSIVFIHIPCPITLLFLFTFYVPLLCCFYSHSMSEGSLLP